jgi:hypothetical protein
VALALCCGALVSVVAQNAPKPDAASAPAAAAAPAPEAAASAPAAAEPPPDVVCFESRKGGATDVTQRELKPGLPNVKCSPKTGAALWYGDPYWTAPSPWARCRKWKTCPKARRL